MGITVQDVMAENDAYSKQSTEEQNAKQSQEALQGGEQPQPSFLQKWVTGPMGRVTTSMMDSAVSAADAIGPLNPSIRVARDAATGAITGVANTVDAAVSGVKAVANGASDATNFDGEDTVPLTSPIWDHAKSSILDFRDAVAVKDPTLSDNLVQGAAQLAIPFAGWSRALAGLHGFANLVGAGAVTDATALGPHDPRMADLLALGRHTEGKFGEALRTMAPDGSAVNAYINYLTDRGDESEAEGRFKNVLDGFGTNLIVTPLFHAVASGLKYGTRALGSAMDNGVRSTSDLAPTTTDDLLAGDKQDMSLSKEERAAERARVAAERAKEEGGTGELEPEPIPANAARREGAAAQRDNPSTLENDPAATAARTFLKSQVDAGHEGSLHAMVSTLSQHLDATTSDGAFYKDILGRLSAKNLGTTITAPGEGVHPKLTDVAGNTAGKYSHVEDTMALYPPAFTSNKTLVHTVAHEAVHAATVQAINKTPMVRNALSSLMNEALVAQPAGTKPAYGFKNPKEFVAEAEANPKFQRLLKDTKAADGRPVWDHYKEVIGGIFGITGAALLGPQFDKLLTRENENS